MPKLPKTKKCAKCNRHKKRHLFDKDKKSKDKLQSYCKVCKRDITIFNKYGLTKKQWNAMFKKQGKLCALCGGKKTSKNGWVVDHDHTTGKVRAILCDSCNVGLGRFRDDPMIMEMGKQYLLSFK